MFKINGGFSLLAKKGTDNTNPLANPQPMAFKFNYTNPFSHPKQEDYPKPTTTSSTDTQANVP